MHLSPRDALDWLDGKLSVAQGVIWTNHLSQCTDCTKQISEWKQLCSLLTAAHLENAPRDTIGMAEAIHQPTEKPRKLREIIASLVFDSFAQPAFEGARGTAAARQFLFSAEDYDIHVKVWGPPPTRRMAGQILNRGERKFVIEGTKLHLLRNEEPLETTEADWFGEFEFETVPEGFLNLRIELPLVTVTGAVHVG